MSNQFCPRLTHQLECSLSSQGLTLRPCCRFKEPITVQSPEELQRARDSFNSITDWTENCEFCRQEESVGLRSYRHRALSKYPQQPNLGLAELVIITDNRCNAACLSCDASDSSMWDAFNKKHGLAARFPVIKTPLSTAQAASLFDLQSFSDLRELSFIGGEPFYSPIHKEWLRLLCDRGFSRQIKLKYTTNGSIRPDLETQALWQQFKDVGVQISVDATGDQFHYLRWPLQWHQLERTVDWFLNYENTAYINYNCTVGLMNLFSAHRLADWVYDKFMPRFSGICHLAFNPCRQEIGLDKITPQMRDQYLTQHSSDTRLAGLTAMVRGLDLPAITHPNSKTMSYINTMDGLRKLSWQSTFPELIPFLPK